MADKQQYNNSNKESQKLEKQLNTYARYSGLAVQMFAIIGVGTFIGYKLDENYPNKHNLFTLFATLSSVIISIIYIIRRIIATSKEEQ
ncbi:AtpZ/AtpI family protein [uncultured Algibacter sp.]|uniref:AtpZ/AtpI family protein n=1 Tax=uncultured Algibacter sp. TaxID=298659 RepID=UPI00262226A4|nr:AtpZ/AtpI family protein [uncultured Algibacter sp.]